MITVSLNVFTRHWDSLGERWNDMYLCVKKLLACVFDGQLH